MQIELTTIEKADLEALIALALDEYVPDEFPDHLDTLEYRQKRISRALLYAGEVERAMQYIGLVEVAECQEIHLAEDIANAYSKSGQIPQAVLWEERVFELASEQPDFDSVGHFNADKHEVFCNLAKLAHDRGDLLQMERCLNAIQLEQTYYSNQGLQMIDQLAQCEAYSQLRLLLRYLPPLTLTLSYNFAGVPVVKSLLRHGLELEFWALVGATKNYRDEGCNSLLYRGIGYAVELNQIPLAFRIMSVETSGETTLFDELCKALVKAGKECELKPFLDDSFQFQSLSLRKYLQALATYVRAAWNLDAAFILENTMRFWNQENELEPDEKSIVACILTWLNHWEGPISIEDLREIKGLDWRPLIEPSLVHKNWALLDLVFEIVGKKDQWRCYLYLELEKVRLGQADEIGAGVQKVLADWEAFDGPWTWRMLEGLYEFARRELRDADSMAKVLDFAQRKSIKPSKFLLKWHIDALAKVGRIAETLPFIPLIETPYERIEAISNCITSFFEFKRKTQL